MNGLAALPEALEGTPPVVSRASTNGALQVFQQPASVARMPGSDDYGEDVLWL